MRVRLRPTVHWRMIDDEVVAVDVEGRGEYLAINGSGALLWPALDDGATPGELATRLQSAYGLDHTTATRDVQSFLADLRRLGVVH